MQAFAAASSSSARISVCGARDSSSSVAALAVGPSHHHRQNAAAAPPRGGGGRNRPISSSNNAAARASSGGEAGPSSSSSSQQQQQQQQRAQKPVNLQQQSSANAAIGILSGLQGNPWSVGTYHSKRATHMVNELGGIIGEEDAPENILQQPGWDAAGKLRFCVSTVAAELGMEEAAVDAKMQQLFKLVPGLHRRIGDVRVADIVRMVASLPDVAAAFVKLRAILPTADLAKIVEGRPSILLDDLDVVAARVSSLKEETPKLNWDAILTDFPALFEVKDPAANVRELAGKFPGQDVTAMLGRQPLLLMSVQSRGDMISYDNGSLQQVKDTIRGVGTSEGW